MTNLSRRSFLAGASALLARAVVPLPLLASPQPCPVIEIAENVYAPVGDSLSVLIPQLWSQHFYDVLLSDLPFMGIIDKESV